jgi:hypothetical protein
MVILEGAQVLQSGGRNLRFLPAKRYNRPYRSFTIPLSIFAREWQKMTGHEPEAGEVIRRRLAVAIQK